MKYKDIMHSVIFLGVISVAVKSVRADDGFGFDSMDKYQVRWVFTAIDSILIYFGLKKKKGDVVSWREMCCRFQ